MSRVGSDFYVYVHLRQTDGSVFYVGKGRQRRAWSSGSRNEKWKSEADANGLFVHIAKERMSEPCALTLERIGISMIGLDGLVNQRAGGRGNSGWKQTDEAKAQIGNASRGRKKRPESIAKTRAAHLGVKRSPEVCAKAKEAASRRKKRPPHSAETRAKIAASHIGLKPSAEALEKMRAAVRSSGKDHPNYDLTARNFVHSDGSVFSGTRADFVALIGGRDSCVSYLISGKRKSVKGWKIK